MPYQAPRIFKHARGFFYGKSKTLPYLYFKSENHCVMDGKIPTERFQHG